MNPTVKNLTEKYDPKPPFVKKGAHAYLYTMNVVGLLWRVWAKYAHSSFKVYIHSIKNNYAAVYYPTDELHKLIDDFLAKLTTEPEFLERNLKDWQAACSELEEQIKTFQDVLDSHADFGRLKQSYESLFSSYLYEYGLSCAAQEACGLMPEVWIVPEIQVYCAQYGLDYNATLATLTSPVDISFVTQEELELMKIALYPVQKQQEAVETHVGRWYWIKNNYADIKVLPVGYFLDRLREFGQDKVVIETKIGEIQKAPQKAKQTKSELLAKHPVSEKLAFYIRINEVFALMQDIRKSYVLRLNHYHKIFLEQAASAKGWDPVDLRFYTYHELMGALAEGSPLSSDELDRRRRCLVSFTSQDSEEILSGSAAEEMIEQLEGETEQSQAITGMTANHGKARGTVKVVLTTHHLTKFNPGDVLVSSMTRPEMVSVMRQAAAFVTDEGGITSHAAIVSRELGIPCIIGTKIASKVLHDGDEVEVDADKGIVKILSRA
ncbi:MAG: PEP-utilizing enzyme [Patescibacteria group bacterium]